MNLQPMACVTEDSTTLVALAIVGGVAGLFSLLLWAVLRGKGRSMGPVIGIVFGSTLGVLLIVFAARRLGGDPHFETYEIDGGDISLHVPWPRSDIRLPIRGIDGISVERGHEYRQHRGGRTTTVDLVWVQLSAKGQTYGSCHTINAHGAAAAGNALASALGKPADWRVHCPHDGHELPSTEAVVVSNTTDVAGLCGAKR